MAKKQFAVLPSMRKEECTVHTMHYSRQAPGPYICSMCGLTQREIAIEQTKISAAADKCAMQCAGKEEKMKTHWYDRATDPALKQADLAAENLPDIKQFTAEMNGNLNAVSTQLKQMATNLHDLTLELSRNFLGSELLEKVYTIADIAEELATTLDGKSLLAVQTLVSEMEEEMNQ